LSGATQADTLRAYLVPADLKPAEPERADDALRFYVANVNNDGRFSIEHIAPGRYKLIVRPALEANPAADAGTRFVSDAQVRARLRRGVEDAPAGVLDLAPCQHATFNGNYPLEKLP
jgi:hypothetical protein